MIARAFRPAKSYSNFWFIHPGCLQNIIMIKQKTNEKNEQILNVFNRHALVLESYTCDENKQSARRSDLKGDVLNAVFSNVLIHAKTTFEVQKLMIHNILLSQEHFRTNWIEILALTMFTVANPAQSTFNLCHLLRHIFCDKPEILVELCDKFLTVQKNYAIKERYHFLKTLARVNFTFRAQMLTERQGKFLVKLIICFLKESLKKEALRIIDRLVENTQNRAMLTEIEQSTFVELVRSTDVAAEILQNLISRLDWNLVDVNEIRATLEFLHENSRPKLLLKKLYKNVKHISELNEVLRLPSYVALHEFLEKL